MPINMAGQAFAIGVGNEKNIHNSSKPITESINIVIVIISVVCFHRLGSQNHSRFGGPMLILGPGSCTALHMDTCYIIYLQWRSVFISVYVCMWVYQCVQIHTYIVDACMNNDAYVSAWTLRTAQINYIWSDHPSI